MPVDSINRVSILRISEVILAILRKRSILQELLRD
jgi:hypothetical protein